MDLFTSKITGKETSPHDMTSSTFPPKPLSQSFVDPNLLRPRPLSVHSLEAQVAALRLENEKLLKEREGLSKGIPFGSPNAISELTQKIALLTSENNRKDALIVDLTNKNQALEAEALTLHHDLQNIRHSKINLPQLVTDNTHLAAVIEEKNKEIEALRRKSNINTDMGNTLNELNRKIAALQNDNMHLSALLEQRPSPRIDLELQSKIAALQTEVIRLADENHVLKAQLPHPTESHLMANELTRLSQHLDMRNREINARHEELGVLYSELEELRKHKNDWLSERESWTNEIARLRQRVLELDQENHAMHAEVDKHRSLAGQREQEAIKGLEDLKSSQKLASDREQFIVNEYSQKMKLLAGENERLNGVLAKQRKEIDNLKQTLHKSGDIEGKIAALVAENQKLAIQLNTKIAECDAISQHYQQLEEENTKLEDEIESINSNKDSTKEENERLKKKCDTLAQDLSKIQSEVVNLHELEQHYGMLVHDKEGWNELIKSKNNEISELMQKCLQLETAVTRFGELESKCVFFAAENDKLNTILLDRTREIAILKDKLSEIERLRTIEDKSLQLMKETERLAAELELAFRQNEFLKNRVRDLEEKLSKVREVENHVDSLVNEHNKMNAVLQAKNRECDDLRRRLHHYEASVEKLGQAEARIESLNDEIERLNIIVTEKGRDAETLRQRLAGTEKGLSKWREIETKYDILQSEYQNLQEILRERENEVHSWRIKYEGAMKRASMVDELDKKFGSLKSERDTLARGLEEKTRTIGNLEQNLLDHENLDQFVISLLAQKVLFAAEFERLHGRIGDLEGENIAMQERMILLGESETAIAKLEHMMEELANENQRLTDMVDERTAEGLAWKAKFENKPGVENFEYKLAILAEENAKLEARLATYEQEIQKLGDQLVLRTNECETLRVKVKDQSLQDLIRHLQVENEKLNTLNKEYLRENELWRGRIRQYEEDQARIGELEAKLEILARENSRLNQNLNQKITECENWRQKLMATESSISGKFGDLNNQMTLMEGDNIKLTRAIEDKDREIARLNSMCNQLDSSRKSQVNLEQVVRALKMENESLQTLLNTRVAEIEKYQDKINTLAQEIMKIPDYEARLGVSKRELDRANQEMENWKFKAQKLEENLEQIGRENQDLHRGLLHKSQENENLKMSHTQLELMKNRQGQMEAASQSTIEQLRNRLRTLEQDTAKLSLTVKTLNEENEMLRSGALMAEGHKSIIGDLNTRIMSLTMERENLMLELERVKQRLLDAEKHKPVVLSGSGNKFWGGANLEGALGMTMLIIEIERLHTIMQAQEVELSENIENLRNLEQENMKFRVMLNQSMMK